jgi:hypothetical protein
VLRCFFFGCRSKDGCMAQVTAELQISGIVSVNSVSEMPMLK